MNLMQNANIEMKMKKRFEIESSWGTHRNAYKMNNKNEINTKKKLQEFQSLELGH